MPPRLKRITIAFIFILGLASSTAMGPSAPGPDRWFSREALSPFSIFITPRDTAWRYRAAAIMVLLAARWSAQALPLDQTAKRGDAGAQSSAPKKRRADKRQIAAINQRLKRFAELEQALDQRHSMIRAKNNDFFKHPLVEPLMRRTPPRGDIAQEMFRGLALLFEFPTGLQGSLEALKQERETMDRMLDGFLPGSWTPLWETLRRQSLDTEQALSPYKTRPFGSEDRWTVVAHTQLFAVFAKMDGSVLIREIQGVPDSSQRLFVLYLAHTSGHLDWTALQNQDPTTTRLEALPFAPVAAEELPSAVQRPPLQARLNDLESVPADFAKDRSSHAQLSSTQAAPRDAAENSDQDILRLAHGLVEQLTGIAHSDRGAIEERIQAAAADIVHKLTGSGALSSAAVANTLNHLQETIGALRDRYMKEVRNGESDLTRAQRVLVDEVRRLTASISPIKGRRTRPVVFTAA